MLTGPNRPAVIAAPGGPTFLLKKVAFDPSTFLTRQELDAVAAPYIGKRVDIATVQRIVKTVNDLYAERKIATAAAYLPPQDLNAGTLRIGIVEGKLGKVEIRNGEQQQGVHPSWLVEQVGEECETRQQMGRQGRIGDEIDGTGLAHPRDGISPDELNKTRACGGSKRLARLCPPTPRHAEFRLASLDPIGDRIASAFAGFNVQKTRGGYTLVERQGG